MEVMRIFMEEVKILQLQKLRFHSKSELKIIKKNLLSNEILFILPHSKITKLLECTQIISDNHVDTFNLFH